MSELIRAFIVIAFLSPIGFYLARKLAPIETPSDDFNRWRNVWFAVSIFAFLSHNIWLYFLLSAILILKITKKADDKLALYFILAFIIPPLSARIHAFGIVNYLFDITHPRFISLIVLLPASLAIAKTNDFKFIKAPTDKFLLIFGIIKLFVEFRDRTFTDGLRQLIYAGTDIFLPYYVASRGIKTLPQINTTLYAFITSAVVISLIAVVEILKHWLLYNPLINLLAVGYEYGAYMGRDGTIRASASLAHPIVLGYFFTVALSFYFYLSGKISSPKMKMLGGGLIILGSMAAVSRGPWVGAIAALLVFNLLGARPLKKLGKLFALALVCIPIVMASPYGEKVYNLIPFVGKTDDFNVDYRQRLFDTATVVINENPVLGSANWRESPEMQQMVQGEGIIDIVNTYILVGLNLGYTGVMCYVMIFISVLIAVYKSMRRIKDKNDPLYILGASLISAIVSIMVMIASTSPILAVPIIYWTTLGLGVAYTRIVIHHLKSDPTKSST